MGLFDKMREPVFLKEDSSAQAQLAELERLLPKTTGKVKTQIEQDIRNLQYGIAGENRIIFELKNSHMPMYVLHDLHLDDGEQSAQIDFYIVTPKIHIIIECKNLYGDIEITSDGNFIRTSSYNGKEIKEGIYSPITQNERHLQLIKKIKTKNSGAVWRAVLEKSFPFIFKSLVVLANPKTILNDKNAPPKIREQVVRADHLIQAIEALHSSISIFSIASLSPKEMEEAANSMLRHHKEVSKDYTEKYHLPQKLVKSSAKSSAATAAPNPKAAVKKAAEKTEEKKEKEVQLCPECQGKLVWRRGRYGYFLGCSNYPECKYTQKLPPKKKDE
ncbi:MAG: hypothetical protein HFG18_00700 [Oscillospiraceae bacterium]|nr:hypothetical protein [Oscillospiraceae bacterium]MCI9362987.1 hypothetical protein [Oscillospiraceae bacterium]RKJ55326.1 hypothetical protein D7X25_08260 [bacterium 1XD42-8]RKJ66446.1 hypothetical protein D7Y09_03925 [bacterium 1XD42-1]